jgi:hypothetical protein
MVTVENLKKEVQEIKTRVNPEPKHFIIDMAFSTNDEPHGFLNGSLFHLAIDKHGKETKWNEAIDTQTELASKRAYYDNVISNPKYKFMNEPTHPSHSFDRFVEYSRCKCGKHGADNKQPYLGECP